MGVLRTQRTVLQQCKIAAEHGLLGLSGGSTCAAPEPTQETLPRPAVQWLAAAAALTLAAPAAAAGLTNRRRSAS